jgi:hypothetical protein
MRRTDSSYWSRDHTGPDQHLPSRSSAAFDVATTIPSSTRRPLVPKNRPPRAPGRAEIGQFVPGKRRLRNRTPGRAIEGLFRVIGFIIADGAAAKRTLQPARYNAGGHSQGQPDRARQSGLKTNFFSSFSFSPCSHLFLSFVYMTSEAQLIRQVTTYEQPLPGDQVSSSADAGAVDSDALQIRPQSAPKGIEVSVVSTPDEESSLTNRTWAEAARASSS